MAPGSFHSNPFNLIKPSLTGLRINLKTTVLTYLTLIGAFLVAAFLTGLAIGFLGGLGALVIIVFIVIGFTYFTLPAYRLSLAAAKKVKISYREVFAPAPGLSWKFIGTSLLYGLAVAGGLILFIVPGFFFLSWFVYTPYVVLEEGITGTAALSRSKELSSGRRAEALGIVSLSLITQVFEFIPYAGPVITAFCGIVLLPANAKRYLETVELKAKGDEVAATVPVSGANWAALVVGILIAGAVNVANQNRAHNTETQPVFNSVISTTRI